MPLRARRIMARMTIDPKWYGIELSGLVRSTARGVIPGVIKRLTGSNFSRAVSTSCEARELRLPPRLSVGMAATARAFAKWGMSKGCMGRLMLNLNSNQAPRGIRNTWMGKIARSMIQHWGDARYTKWSVERREFVNNIEKMRAAEGAQHWVDQNGEECSATLADLYIAFKTKHVQPTARAMAKVGWRVYEGELHTKCKQREIYRSLRLFGSSTWLSHVGFSDSRGSVALRTIRAGTFPFAFRDRGARRYNPHACPDCGALGVEPNWEDSLTHMFFECTYVLRKGA